MTVDRYRREHDPRDEEWWNRPTRLERTCAACGARFHVDERLERLPHVFCKDCIDKVVHDLTRPRP